ncbi:MAG: hypothetical protein QOD93_1387 [Acetobacteraceae bacterium]|nr:hypothetical protein [Acetobacteraceae bacterium]
MSRTRTGKLRPVAIVSVWVFYLNINKLARLRRISTRLRLAVRRRYPLPQTGSGSTRVTCFSPPVC